MSYTMTENDKFGITTIVEDAELARLLSELPEHLPLSWRVLEDEWNADYTIRTIRHAEILGVAQTS